MSVTQCNAALHVNSLNIRSTYFVTPSVKHKAPASDLVRNRRTYIVLCFMPQAHCIVFCCSTSSEPEPFITLPPDKRCNLVRSPNKKELKGRQFLRIGMDFIRHKGVNDSNSTSACTTKDNQLLNNLDLCSQSKTITTHSDKMTALNQSGGNNSRQCPPREIHQSEGSDSVFADDTIKKEHLALSIPPTFSSTCKQSQTKENIPPVSQSITSGEKTKPTNDSLSSSFDSEALDILASLKSAGALKAQLRHGKFPTDVDPITGSPRHPPIRIASEEKLRLMEGLNGNRSHQPNYPNSNKSSCLSSPNGSARSSLQHHSAVTHRSPAHCQVSRITGIPRLSEVISKYVKLTNE